MLLMRELEVGVRVWEPQQLSRDLPVRADHGRGRQAGHLVRERIGFEPVVRLIIIIIINILLILFKEYLEEL